MLGAPESESLSRHFSHFVPDFLHESRTNFGGKCVNGEMGDRLFQVPLEECILRQDLSSGAKKTVTRPPSCPCDRRPCDMTDVIDTVPEVRAAARAMLLVCAPTHCNGKQRYLLSWMSWMACPIMVTCSGTDRPHAAYLSLSRMPTV